MLNLSHLLSYIETNTGVLSTTSLRNCRLIIDGESFSRDFYAACGLQNQYGGDYQLYEYHCRQFFQHLASCNIAAHIVFEANLKVDEGALEREVSDACALGAAGENMAQSISSDRLRPMLLLLVLARVVEEMRLPTVTCFRDAERNITSLAREWQCHILTMNVTYFLHELNMGIILINNNLQIERKTGNLAHVKGQWYRIDLLRNWKRIPHRNMFVLLLIIFELYRHIEEDMEIFFQNKAIFNMPEMIHSSKAMNKGQNSEHVHQRIDQVLYWLAGKMSREDAIDDLLENIAHRKTEIDTVVNQCVNRLTPLDVLSISSSFSSNSTPYQQLPELKSSNMPDWFLEKATNNVLYANLLKLAVTKTIILHPQVETYFIRSTHSCSATLRKIIYKCIFGANSTINEYIRVSEKIREQNVQTMGGTLIPSVHDVEKMSLEERQKFVLECLVPNANALGVYSPVVRFLVAVVSYWKQTCQIKNQHLHAVLLTFLACLDEYVDKSKVSKQSLLARENLHSTIQQQMRSCHLKSFNAGFVYTFCELQSCLYFAEQINLLMGEPIKCNLACSLNGSLASQIFCCIQDYGEETLAVHNLLLHEDLKKAHMNIFSAVLQFK